VLDNHRDSHIARTALKLFFAIAGKLEASDADQAALLGISNDAVLRYRTGKYLPETRDTLERISHVTSIWLALTSIFRSESGALLWLRSPNETFNGTSPFQRMLAGNVSGLVDVRYEIEKIYAD
jgi:uncharacterized protein (DUF2384 family)